ncbi:hypothetical protein BOI36_24215, partial [Salmonella enterica subsp. enterica serovar O rough]|nr:hypothetical protein [Salmonella enterica subsp. enterica serovar O rough]
MVVPCSGWPAGNVNEQRESGVAGWSGKQIERVMNEYSDVALAAGQHAKHPFKNFLEQIFHMPEQEFMKIVPQDGRLKLFAEALANGNEQSRRDLGITASVWGEDWVEDWREDEHLKGWMFRCNEGTVVLFTIEQHENGWRYEVRCGPELGCGGESLWDSLQHKFEQGMPGAVGLATGIMKKAAQEFNKTGDMIMASIQAAITFSAHDPDRFPPLTFVSALNDMRSLYLDGPWISENRDLSVLGDTPEFAELTSAATGSIIANIIKNIYGRVDLLKGLNMGFCGGTEHDWFGLSMPGNARVVTGPWQESGTVIMQRKDNDIIDIFLCGGGSIVKHLQVTCTQSPISRLEVMRGDLEAYDKRIEIETAKTPLEAAEVLREWTKWDNHARLDEARRCFDDLRAWIDGGRDPEAEPDIPEQVSKDELQNEQSEWILYRVSLFVDAVRNAI